MATSIRNLSSPGLHPTYTPKGKGQGRVQKTASDWPVADLFSQDPQRVTALLGRVMHDRNQIIHNICDTPFIDQYEKNTKALQLHIVEDSEGIKGQFKKNVTEASRSDFIHVICDTAHMYQGQTGDEYSRLFTAANYLLEKKADRLSRDSGADIDYFLNPIKTEYPIQTIYAKTDSRTYASLVLAPKTFGNILFRLNTTDDIVFSPVFLHYLEKKAPSYVQAIPSKQATWADLQQDDMFFELGYKKLTDRDAVAHYRWLTEVASREDFTAYLTRTGHSSDTKDYPCQARKDLLADLSKQYWHLGHGGLSHPSAAVEGTHFQGASVLTAEKNPSPQRRPLARLDYRSHQKVQALQLKASPLSAESLIKENPLRWCLGNGVPGDDEQDSLFQWRSDDGALVEVDYPSAANRPRALFPLASTSSSDSNTDSENDAMPFQIHRYKRRPNPSVSRPTHLEDARSQSQGEYRRLLDTSSDGASSGSENTANRVGYYGSFSRDSREVPPRNSLAGHRQRPAYVPPLRRNMTGCSGIYTKPDQRYQREIWKPLQVAAPPESRKRKPEQPPMESTFRYIAPRYVERITYMEPEKIIRTLYYPTVIKKQQKDMAYKIGSFFKKLFFAIRMR